MSLVTASPRGKGLRAPEPARAKATVPVKVRCESDNPMENAIAIEQMRLLRKMPLNIHWKMPLKIHNDFSGADFWRATKQSVHLSSSPLIFHRLFVSASRRRSATISASPLVSHGFFVSAPKRSEPSQASGRKTTGHRGTNAHVQIQALLPSAGSSCARRAGGFIVGETLDSSTI